jgi:hypothetical protein
MTQEKYKIALMFEWGGGCLWGKNTATFDRFDVGPIEEKLQLTDEIIEELHRLTEWHDTALNWEYPPDPGPWEKKEYEAFERAALEILQKIKTQLGSEFDVYYDPLGKFEGE